MKRILIVIGTRPEAIKMCPLVNELKKREGFEVFLCVSGQHREMLDGALRIFGVVPDRDLSVMREGQTLFDVTSEIFSRIRAVLDELRPDIVLVHGDTTTAFVGAVSAFYFGIPVGHVEAGLRTNDIFSPFPEEFNRKAISLVSSYDFAPTAKARANLEREGKGGAYVTGNTVIDSFSYTLQKDFPHSALEWAKGNKLILLTAHRRENIGDSMRDIFKAFRRILEEYDDLKAIYPVHPNPKVREIAEEVFSGCDRIQLIAPLDVVAFHNIMARSYMIVTDSGGIQEEASYLGIPTLVVRERTERGEAGSLGNPRLVGRSYESVYNNLRRLLDKKEVYCEMAKSSNLYGDGKASVRIADILEKI